MRGRVLLLRAALCAAGAAPLRVAAGQGACDSALQAACGSGCASPCTQRSCDACVKRAKKDLAAAGCAAADESAYCARRANATCGEGLSRDCGAAATQPACEVCTSVTNHSDLLKYACTAGQLGAFCAARPPAPAGSCDAALREACPGPATGPTCMKCAGAKTHRTGLEAAGCGKAGDPRYAAYCAARANETCTAAMEQACEWTAYNPPCIACVKKNATAAAGCATPLWDAFCASRPPLPPPTPRPTPPPQPCIADTSPGLHENVPCDYWKGMKFTYNVPARCVTETCGLIIDVHGFTMSAASEDKNTNMRALGEAHGFIVVQPTAAGNNWNPDAVAKWKPPYDVTPVGDAAIYSFLQEALKVDSWKIDTKRLHFMGFSEGGWLTGRMLCQHPDVFASFVLLEGASNADPFACLKEGSPQPPLLAQNGINDASSKEKTWTPALAGAVRKWGLGAGKLIAGDGTTWNRTRYTSAAGTPLEVLSYTYVADYFLKGHCFPGSDNLKATRIAGDMFPYGCPGAKERANGEVAGYVIGDEAMKFFLAHPKPGAQPLPPSPPPTPAPPLPPAPAPTPAPAPGPAPAPAPGPAKTWSCQTGFGCVPDAGGVDINVCLAAC